MNALPIIGTNEGMIIFPDSKNHQYSKNITMRKYPFAALTFAALAFVALNAGIALNAGAQTNPLFSHIPPDANSAYHINLPALTTKLSWEELTKSLPIPKNNGSGGDMTTEMIKDPAAAGVDIHADLVIAGSNRNGFDSASYTTVVFHLLDSSLFRQFLGKQYKGLRIVRYPNKTFSALRVNMGIAWDRSLAVFVMAHAPTKDFMPSKNHSPEPKPGAPSSKPGPPAHGGDSPDYPRIGVKRALAALKGFNANYYTTDPAFLAAFSTDADVQMANEKAGYPKSMQKMIPFKMMGGLNSDSLAMFERSFSELRFDAGRISMTGRMILKPKLADLLAKFAPTPLKTDLLARLPKRNLLGVADFRLNLSMIRQMMQMMGLQKKIDSMMNAKDTWPADLVRAFAGDILIAALVPEHPDTSGKPKPDLFFIAGVSDTAAMLRLAARIKKMSEESLTADSSDKKAAKAAKLARLMGHFSMKDDILVISNTDQMAEAYFTNTEKRNTDFLTGALTENPMGIYINIRALARYMLNPGGGEPTEKNKKLLDKIQPLDKLIITAGAIHNGEMHTSLELLMDNHGENSLKTLVGMMH